MKGNLLKIISALEEYPTAVTILAAIIGFAGIIVTQVIIHYNAERDTKRERITDYIGSLRLQVLCTHDRLAVLRARRIEVKPGDNSIKFIDNKEIKSYDDIRSSVVNLNGVINMVLICALSVI